MRDGAVTIPDVPGGFTEGVYGFLSRLKEAVEVLQGTHGRAPEARRAPTLAEAVRRVDRGDPPAADFTSLTTDGAVHDLDLSGIVPIGTKAVELRVTVNDDAVQSYLALFKKGNSNQFNSLVVRSQVVNVTTDGYGTVSVDASRRIQYLASNVAFVSISVTVCAWWI